MISPREIRASTLALAGKEGHYSETPEVLDVKGVFTEPVLNQWKRIATELSQAELGTLAVTDSFGVEIDLRAASVGDLTDEARLRLKKSSPEGTCNLFFSSTLPQVLADWNRSVSTHCIQIAEDFAPFASASCVVEQWDAPAECVFPDFNLDPRKFVRDFTGSPTVPMNVGFYLLTSKPIATSAVFNTWSTSAATYLALSLLNEVWRDKDQLMIALIGPRTKRMPFGTQASVSADVSEQLQQAATWVYDGLRDTEVKHTLLTNELAREWPETTFINEIAAHLPRALDSAKTAYRAHIREGSKETLKTLGELRKTLNEEVSKVSAQTRELIATLWKDFAVAATALLSRVALIIADKKAAANSVPMRIILIGTGVFLATNLLITLRTNSRFMKIAQESRSAWKTKLFGFLSNEDLETLAEKPINDSVTAYDQAKRVVVSIYIAVLLFLVTTSFPGLISATAASLKQWFSAHIHCFF